MTDPTDPHSMCRDISSLADAELNAISAARLQQQLMSDAPSAEMLQQLQHLNSTARRAVRDHTSPPSKELRDRLLRLLGDETSSQKAVASKPIQTRKFWSPVFSRSMAAALLLATGVWIGHHWTAPTVHGPNVSQVITDPLPATVISTAEEIHGFCSRLTEGLHDARFPTDLAPLAKTVEADLHSDHPYPDLGSIGYRYRGAGPCGRSLPGTVHLLYRSVRPGSFQAVSVFVQVWHDQYPLAADRLYTVSVASNPFPMLAWRTEKVVYFLLADDADTMQRCADLIRQKPTSGP